MFQSHVLLCFTWQCSYIPAVVCYVLVSTCSSILNVYVVCFSFNMFKHLECLCCFLFFHKNVNLKIVCLYDSIELNKHKFIIATIIISNIKNFHFPFKVLLFQGCLLDLYCIHLYEILLIVFIECIFFTTILLLLVNGVFRLKFFFHIEQNQILSRLTQTYLKNKIPLYRQERYRVHIACNLSKNIILYNKFCNILLLANTFFF